MLTDLLTSAEIGARYFTLDKNIKMTVTCADHELGGVGVDVIFVLRIPVPDVLTFYFIGFQSCDYGSPISSASLITYVI